MATTRPSHVVVRVALGSLLCSLLWVVFTPSSALACSCALGTVETAIQRSDVILGGTPLHVESDEGRNLVTFEVTRVWKGSSVGQVEVVTSWSEASCGLTMRPGEPMILYAEQQRSRLSTGLCSAPFHGGGASVLTRLLGEPRPPTGVTGEPAPKHSPDWVSRWGLGLLLGLFGLSSA